MDSREQRLARTESLFREINERVRQIAAKHGTDVHQYQFYCECSNTDCTLRVELELAEYERVRTRGRRFLVAPGHNLPLGERIVEQAEGWWVIEKDGAAGDFAEGLAPPS